MKVKPQKLLVKVTDIVSAKDRLGVYKWWFNGTKYFPMRVRPPKK